MAKNMRDFYNIYPNLVKNVRDPQNITLKLQTAVTLTAKFRLFSLIPLSYPVSKIGAEFLVSFYCVNIVGQSEKSCIIALCEKETLFPSCDLF
jgi:hypothetical protein